MKVENHKLVGDGIDFVPTPNTSGYFKDNLPDTIVIHYTASGNLKSAITTLTSKESKASAHIVIGRDGSITQLADFNMITWHAGNSYHNYRNGLNNYSIGIELENAGVLTKQDNKYVSWFGKTHPENEVFYGNHKNQTHPNYWHSYTSEQITSVKKICEALKSFYEIKFIVGHDDIAPNRKQDPGPAFPLNDLQYILNIPTVKEEPISNNFNQPEIKGEVTATALNIRSGPGVNFETISDPLLEGSEVEIIDEEGEWLKVEIKTSGWVNKKFINQLS